MDHLLEKTLNRIEADGKLTAHNRDIILQYNRDRAIAGAAPMTRQRAAGILVEVSKTLDKPMETATREDLQKVVMAVEARADYSPWTRCKIKGVIKKFYRYLILGPDRMDSKDDNPPLIAWIRVHVKRKDRPRIGRNDTLTAPEIDTIVRQGKCSRDRALIALLLDIGCRPGELGNLSVGDVYRDDFNFIIHIHGKTGERDVATFSCDPHLSRWLNDHPQKDNPQAPLWLQFTGRERGGQLRYEAIRKVFQAACKSAGIKKRARLYIGRHSMFTNRLSEGVFNESMAKTYGGLTMDSRSLATYAHLTSLDANNRLLEVKGVKVPRPGEAMSKPPVCPACQSVNQIGSHFCDRCGRPLNLQARLSYEHMKSDALRLLDGLAGDPEVMQLLRRKMAARETASGEADHAL